MRRLLTLLFIGALAATMVGCGSSASTDPYEIAHKASSASWEAVQVEVGMSVKSGSTDFTIDKSAIKAIVDSKAGKGSFHLALPLAGMNLDAATLAQLGITGTTIDLDVVYDGAALYAKSPFLRVLLTALYAQSGGLPSGDLSGWLRMGTKADFESMGGAASSALPSMPAASAVDTATFKKDLEDSGIVLSYVGTENRNGVDAYHLKATVDLAKVTTNKALDSLNAAQRAQIAALSKDATVTADLWTDKSKARMVELDLHVASTGTTAGTMELTISMSEPPAGTSYDAPASFVDIPIKDLVTKIMQMVGAGMFGG